jgi:hypothetical protein
LGEIFLKVVYHGRNFEHAFKACTPSARSFAFGYTASICSDSYFWSRIKVIIFGLDLAWAIDLGDRTGKRQMDYRKSLLVSFWGKDYTLNHFPPASEKNMDSGIRKN